MKYHTMNHRSATLTINLCKYKGQIGYLRKTENHFVKLSSLKIYSSDSVLEEEYSIITLRLRICTVPINVNQSDR